MSSRRHLRLIHCAAAGNAQTGAPEPSQDAVPTEAQPVAVRRRKLPPLLPGRRAAAIRKQLRQSLALQIAAVGECVASVDSDASDDVARLQRMQQTIARQLAELRESLRREHNGMRWKRGLSYDEN